MKSNPVRVALVASVLSMTLAACSGGGGGSGANSPASTVTLAGVAAAGSPLAGASVTLKDARGVTKTATTSSNGAYSFDVTGLSAPFVLEAIGIVGGNQVVLHSVAESAPSSGSTTTNITPLTEALVANISSSDPATFFGSPTSSLVTTASLQAAQTSLKTALSTVLTAAGLPADIDLLKTAFSANKTGMDAVLESVKVSATVVNGAPVVQLQNKMNTDEVVTLTGSGAATSTGSITQATLPDLTKLDAVAAAFSTAVASSSAMTTSLPSLFDDDYLEDGELKAAVVARLQGATALVGATFGLPVVENCNTAGDVCRIRMTLKFANGDLDEFPQSIKKQTDGSWKLYGNHYHHSFGLTPVAQKYVRTDGATALASQSGLQFYVDPSVGGVKSAILFIQSPTGGADTEVLRVSQKSAVCGSSMEWLALDIASAPTNCSNVYTMSDTLIDQFATPSNPNPKFRIKVFTDEGYSIQAGAGMEGNGIYSNLRFALPLKSAQLASAPFAALTTSALTNLAVLSASGPLDLSWTGNAKAAVWLISASVQVAPSALRSISSDLVMGLSQVTLSGNDVAGTTTASSARSAMLMARDADGRAYWTNYFGCGGSPCN